MDLLINIGNTHTWFAYMDRDITQSIKIPSHDNNFQDGIIQDLIKKVKRIGISCVVPEVFDKLYKSVKESSNAPITLMNSNMSPLLKDSPYDMDSLGVDRMLAIHGAIIKKDAPFILCDLGTATTLNIVNHQNKLIGGLILPGLSMSLEALKQKTGLLPKITLEGCVKKLPKTTEENIRSGIILSLVYTAQTIAHQTGFPLILTGGHSEHIKSHFEMPVKVYPNLLIEGMRDLL